MQTFNTRAKPGAPDKYIWNKPQSRHLWFRLTVPTCFQPFENKRLIQRNLRTNDRAEARIAAQRLAADYWSRWQQGTAAIAAAVVQARSPVEPTVIDLKIAAFEGGFDAVRTKLAALYRSKGIRDVAGHERYLVSLKSQLLRLIQTREDDALRHWKRVADRAIAARNWQLDPGSDLYAEFLRMIAEAAIDALRVDIDERTNGTATPASTIVVEGAKAKAERCIEGESILELFEKYAAQRLKEGRKRPDTINQDRKVIQHFSTFLGPDRSLKSVQAAEVRNFRDLIGAIPASYRKRKENVGLTLQQAAAKAKREGLEGLSLVTLNKYLSTISPVFDWARSEGYVDHNPCDGLYYSAVKGKNARPPFEPKELNRFLQSPLFTGFAADGEEHLPGSRKANDWRYWIPLVCMFTGARLGEVAQLRVDDVVEEWGIWCIRIRHDESTRQTTKSGQSRYAALHSGLLAIGFLAFVERQRKRADRDGNRSLFPDLKPDNRGQISRTPSKFLRSYLEKIGIKDGGDGRGSHSFRHTLADQLRAADYLDNQIAVALGHSVKTVTGGYGRLQQGTVRMMKDMIEAASFEGVRFDHLWVAKR